MEMEIGGEQMKRLCIAVIVLSFFGFGPLKSLFHNETSTDGKSISEIPVIQQIKEFSKLFSPNDKRKAGTFLIMENNSKKSPPNTDVATIVRYDSVKNKLMVGSILIPAVGKKNHFTVLKKEVQKDYGVTIDHSFIIDPSGLARIIDLLAPNGITINSGITVSKAVNTENKKLNGKEIISLIEEYRLNETNQEGLQAVFSSLKKEIVNQQSTEKWISIAPAIIDEAMSSGETDLGNGRLMELGITVLMNPITTIEPVHFTRKSKNEHEHAVNSIPKEDPYSSVVPLLY